MAKKSKKSSSSKTIRIDFTGVDKGFKLIDEGTYSAKLIEATAGESDAGNPKIDWVFEITQKGKFKGQKLLPFCTSLTPQALWNLRGLLEAIGVEVPEGALDLNLKEVVEEASECSVTVEHNTWEGKKRAKIVDLNTLDGDEDESEDDSDSDDDSSEDDKDEEDDSDEPESDEEEEDAEEEDEVLTKKDFDEMEEDELEAIVGEFDLEDDLEDGWADLSIKKQRKLVCEAYLKAQEEGEDEADDDEDEEEDEGYSEDDILEMSTKELEALIKKHKLKVKLDDFSNTRKKRKAVLKALEAAGLISE